MDEQRMIELETKFLHQEMAIENLHQALLKQMAMIESLEKNLKLLTAKFEAATNDHEVGPANEKPPHY